MGKAKDHSGGHDSGVDSRKRGLKKATWEKKELVNLKRGWEKTEEAQNRSV